DLDPEHAHGAGARVHRVHLRGQAHVRGRLDVDLLRLDDAGGVHAALDLDVRVEGQIRRRAALELGARAGGHRMAGDIKVTGRGKARDQALDTRFVVLVVAQVGAIQVLERGRLKRTARLDDRAMRLDQVAVLGATGREVLERRGREVDHQGVD